MKKMLALMGAVTLGVSAIATSAQLVTTSQNINNKQYDYVWDWSTVKNQNDEYFNDLLNKDNKEKEFFTSNFISLDNTDVELEDVINLAKIESAKQIEMMEEKQFTSQNIIDYFETTLPNYSIDQNDYNLENLSYFEGSKKDSFINLENFFPSKLYDQVYKEMLAKKEAFRAKLKEAETYTFYGSVVAGTAALGFWAASWWFGITVPWAIAATGLSAALFATSIGLSAGIATLDNAFSSRFGYAANKLWDAYKEVFEKVSLLIEGPLATSAIATSSFGWAVPIIAAGVVVLLGAVGFLIYDIVKN